MAGRRPSPDPQERQPRPEIAHVRAIIGEEVRRVSDLDRVRAGARRAHIQRPPDPRRPGARREPGAVIIRPQGNPLQASEDSPYPQIGETKYGRPIPGRRIRFDKTTLEGAAKSRHPGRVADGAHASNRVEFLPKAFA